MSLPGEAVPLLGAEAGRVPAASQTPLHLGLEARLGSESPLRSPQGLCVWTGARTAAEGSLPSSPPTQRGSTSSLVCELWGGEGRVSMEGARTPGRH